MDRQVTIDDDVEVGGILLLGLKRDGASDIFFGKEGAP